MAEMVGDGDEVIFGIFRRKNSALDFGRFSLLRFTVPVCAGRLPRALSIAFALLRHFGCASVDRGAEVPHSCNCKTGPHSDMIYGPTVSWFGTFECFSSSPGDREKFGNIGRSSLPLYKTHRF